ncbi:uroporphyrinogen decarboxylase [Variovorax sp. PCZ-1]|uniref:uroporphyrinogen decarboxylase n=1 Tax=Variovorax sp. PCZ-1 TaxID=2835533 RepID=UPI001BCD5BB0|nr:uroporphyrinogen decarboxylase [Variovorax sp. PCZ-1]MBS7808233.1 uroporphyrinogen decarboxylase [Variovorax sp. PCZ-1]
MTSDFSQLHNPTFLQACLGQATPYTPMWLMRQAGRYLPEYKATRAKAGSFMGLATNRDYATEVTLQPLDRYDLDAAILFSDILTVPDAMGLGLSFETGEGPKFSSPIRDEAGVNKLAVPDMAKLQYVFDAVSSIRKALVSGVGDGGKQRVPLIGFSGSPWTLACYMVEGGGSDDFRLVKSMMYARPDLMHRILAINADSVAAYLNAQIDAGAQAVMVFDSWGGALSHAAFAQFSLAYTQRVLQQLKRTDADGNTVPRIVFTKGGGLWLQSMRDLPCEVIGLDWTCSLGSAREVLSGTGKALQGNIDPNILFAPPEAIAKEVGAVLADFGAPHMGAGSGQTHIFNLGHGISQFTPPEHVSALVHAVKTQSRAMREGAR